MELNIAKFIKNLKELSVTELDSKQRSNYDLYKEKPLSYWNNQLYKKILENNNIRGDTINLYELSR